MVQDTKGKHVRRTGPAFLAALLLFAALPGGAGAVSTFGLKRIPDQEPAAFVFDELWFYDSDRSKQIPEVNLQWVAVAVNAEVPGPSPFGFQSDVNPKGRVLERARAAVETRGEIVDVFYDPNLAEDGCFFSLREGLTETEVMDLLRALNREAWVAYAHPTLTVRGKTVAFFNAFWMEWKTGVEETEKQALMDQAHVSWEADEKACRVDILAVPFFKAINLLAEDLRVLSVTPVLVPLEPSIRVELSVPLQGFRIGDGIPFSLRVEFSDRVRIDPSSLVNINLRPGDIQKELFTLTFDPYDYVKAVSQSPLTLTWWMRIYAPGEFVLPSVEIHYECAACSGDPVRSIKTDEVPLKVASLVPSKVAKAKIVVPTDDVSLDLPIDSLRREARKGLWQGMAAFVVATALLGWSGRLWLALRRERTRGLDEKREDVLAERIRVYLAEDPRGPHWLYVGEAGRQLREMVVVKYRLNRDPRQGSGEVFCEAAKGQVPDRVVSPLRALLAEIDRVIAQESTVCPELERWKRDALALVDLVQSTNS